MKKEEIKKNTENTDISDADDVSFEEVNDEGDELDGKAQIKKLREKIKRLEKEKQEYMLGWQRAQADYANFKKEVETRRSHDIKHSTKRLILDILPVLDAFTMAKSNKTSWEAVDANWRMGIEYILGQLISVLEKDGLKSFGNVGEKFDPNLHESIESVNTDDSSKDDTIESILALGYKLHDSVLRPAKVKTWVLKN